MLTFTVLTLLPQNRHCCRYFDSLSTQRPIIVTALNPQRDTLLPRPWPGLEWHDGTAVWCRAGEEVTISYGRWSSEVFFLFFGFLPPDNPWDSVALFADLSEMIAYHDELEVGQPCACISVRETSCKYCQDRQLCMACFWHIDESACAATCHAAHCRATSSADNPPLNMCCRV